MAAATYEKFSLIFESSLVIKVRREIISAHVRRWWARVLVTILGGVLLVYAQILPVFTRRALPALAERMSAIESEDELREFRGKLHLARYVLNTLKRYSLFRSVADEVVSELEEHIDSIDFVLGNRSRLDAAMSNLDKCA